MKNLSALTFVLLLAILSGCNSSGGGSDLATLATNEIQEHIDQLPAEDETSSIGADEEEKPEGVKKLYNDGIFSDLKLHPNHQEVAR